METDWKWEREREMDGESGWDGWDGWRRVDGMDEEIGWDGWGEWRRRSLSLLLH